MAEPAVRTPTVGSTAGLVTASFDPAAETAPDGRSLLQVRLGLWGKVVTLLNVGYWVAWWFTYVGPSGDPAATERIAPAALLAAAAYLALWRVGTGRPRPMPFLRTIDVMAFGVIGVSFAFGVAAHPVPHMVALEAPLGMLLMMFLRAILIPSGALRTLLVGLLLVSPSIAVSFVRRETLAPGNVPPGAYWVTFLTWCAMACGVSTVAAAIVYGLGRRVHDARRLGQYTLVERIGQGGMGVVYRAKHALLRRPTAVKLLSPEAGHSQARFEQEVQLMAQISHPNIVTVHDYGRTSTGIFYYVMELLDGMDLERLVQRHGAQPAERVVHVLLQASAGLARAHAAGLVHRDVKPANIFLCRTSGDPDTVKLLDFGLVKDLRDETSPELTTAQQFLGTPLYMAPEASTDPGSVGARSDLYALGAVGYYLACGQPVFRGHTMVEVTARHIHEAPMDLRERAAQAISPELDEIVMRCLAKAPTDRFADAESLRRALERCPEAGRWSHERAVAWWSDQGANTGRIRPDDAARMPFLETLEVERTFTPEARS